MQISHKRRPGRILRALYPTAKYAAVLLIPLSLYRLPRQAWLLPGVTGPRAVLMLWPALLMVLGLLSDRRAHRAREQDGQEQKNKASAQGSRYLSFLALCVPGLLLADLAAAAHLYLSWYSSVPRQPAVPESVLPLTVMAMGCVLWIYGCVLPDIHFGSVWGLRTHRTLVSPEAWQEFHRKSMGYFLAAGIVLLAAGTLVT